MPSLSVIIPAYNEDKSIAAALDDVLVHVAATVPDCEIIVVDDGSRDATAAIVAERAAGEPRIRLLGQPNRGHGAALMNGLAQARGDWLLLIDSDRQVSLADFPGHWALTGGLDAILGVREPRHDPAHRLLISAAMRVLLRLRLGVGLRDAGAPYKLVRAGLWRDARAAMRPACWIPSVLLAARAMQRHDLRTVEIAIAHRARAHGPSTLNLRRLARFCREGLTDIAHFRAHAGRPRGRSDGDDRLGEP